VTRIAAHLLFTGWALHYRQLLEQARISISLVLVLIAHRSQAQHGERVRHAHVGQLGSTVGHHAALIGSRATAQTRPTALDMPSTPHTRSDQGE